eukprot:Anaeramoba_ignava/a219625_11.p2 GENE.a219625_11~~a219625_11.p2  ORF type:complete len:208 (+),score=19.92 a219625_11:211-834(+)
MKQFNKSDIKTLKEIMLLRRDVRGNRFLKKKIDDKILDEILSAANSAPSVGFSQPWKFVIVKSKDKREEIYKEFEKENNKAKKIFKDKEIYPRLKLEGIKESYINVAVLYEKPKKKVLGQTTQKKMGEYSVVCAIQNLWLMARAYNIGVGWISILKPKNVKKILGLGKEYKLVAYLAIGYVDEFLEEPELLQIEWEKKKSLKDIKTL